MGRRPGAAALGYLENTPSALGNNPAPTRKSRRGYRLFVLFQNVQNYGQRKNGELPTISVAELSSKFSKFQILTSQIAARPLLRIFSR
jgi:hypothetical protein